MDIQLPQILFQIVNFSVVVGALTYLLYKPVQKVLEERATRIEESQRAAEKILSEKNAIDELKKQSEKEARKQAAQILEDAKKDAEKLAHDLTTKAQEHAKAQLLKVQTEWQEQKKELVRDLRQQFADAVVKTTAKIGMSMDKKAHMTLIDEELESLLKRI